MSSPALAASVLGRQEPRVLTVPPSAAASLVEDALAMWDLTGRRLDPWQETTCEPLFAVNEAGSWACSEFGLLVSRQQGKGEILQVYDLAHLFLWPKPNGEPKVILHTAHEFATVDVHYRKLKRVVTKTPWMRRQLKDGGREDSRGIHGINTGMGRRVFELENGNMLILQSRTGSAGVGFTVDVLVVDEAQESPAETMEALLFTQDGVANTQAFYTGTVPTATQDGAHFESVRDRGRAGTFPRTGWVEFSPDGSDDPDTAAAIDPSDREVWAQSSPALGRRTALADIEDKYNALMPTNPDAFIKQRLSIWPNQRPETERSVNDIDLRAWNNCDDGVRLAGRGVVLAVSLGRGGGYSSICGAQDAGDGLIRVEHLATAERTLWVSGKLLELRRRFPAAMVIVDERNAAPILSDFERDQIRPFKANTSEVGAAYELCVEQVNAELVRHPGQEELTLSFKFAEPRAMGRGLQTWSQSNPMEPVTLAQAATLAMYGVRRQAAQRPVQTAPVLPATLASTTAPATSGRTLPNQGGDIWTRRW